MVVSDIMTINEIADTEISRLKKIVLKGNTIISLSLELPIHLMDFEENESVEVSFGLFIEDDPDYRFLARGTIFQIDVENEPTKLIASIGGLRTELLINKEILENEKILDADEIYLGLK